MEGCRPETWRRIGAAALLVMGAVAGTQELLAESVRLDQVARPIRMEAVLELDPAAETFPGRVRIELELQQSSSLLWLHADRLQDLQVQWTHEGKPVRLVELLERHGRLGLRVDPPLPPGRGTLEIAYRGRVENVDSAGLFRQRDGEEWYLFSQLQAYDARRVFPCFDEPSFKIPWKVTLRVRREHEALSNMPALRTRELGDGWKEVDFEESPPLPSYLLAFAVGPFEYVDGGRIGKNRIPSRIVVPRGRAAEGEYAARTTPQILETLENYFGIPYPYPKLDQIALLHTVGFGAMENPGLVTYTERLILFRPGESTEERRRAWQGVAAHELAHQWFGNLVTLAWWDDTWLNEGFATWMTNKVLEQLHPDWRADLGRLERRAAAMANDALASARKVRQEIVTEGDIRNAFDAITYSKGASLLAMFEGWIGEERFREAVRTYLGRHAHGTATSRQFLETLAEKSNPSTATALASFLDQPGIPLVSARLECLEGRTPGLLLSQSRYFPLGSPAGARTPATWQVPMRWRWSAPGGSGELRVLLGEAETSVELPAGTACPEWVVGNAEGVGYYLVRYEPDLAMRLLDPATPLPAGERLSLLRDLQLLVRSGDVQAAAVLERLDPWIASQERHLVEASIGLARLGRAWVPQEFEEAYRSWIRGRFGPRLEQVGRLPALDEPADAVLLRNELLRIVGQEGRDPSLRAWAREQIGAWLREPAAVPADLLPVVLRLAASGGDESLWQRLGERVRAEPSRRIRQQLFGALGQFEDPRLLERSFDLLLDSAFDIRDALGIVQQLPEAHADRERLWDWLERNFDALARRLPEQLLARLPGWSQGLCAGAARDRVRDFLKPRLAQAPGAERNLAQALEAIDLCVAGREAQAPSLGRFLANLEPRK